LIYIKAYLVDRPELQMTDQYLQDLTFIYPVVYWNCRGRKNMNKKMVVGIIVLLFVMTTFTTSIQSDANISTILLNDGNLSGYVSDTLMNPIPGARVRVHFHGTYEEDYTDSSGYYHVTNIPICYCLKNATASKEGYETEWVLLSITENTTYDFVLEPLTDYNGSLSGYVNNTLMNPIPGARVRVHFHGTYEEDYTDSSGYYHVTNIPICYCLKNATASKEGYETEWILLSITENTTHDFVLTSLDPVPDLDCDGSLCWTDVEPGATVTGSFTVENIGATGSELNWEIESYPDWGTWTFTPDSGTGLTPEDGAVTIDVEVIWPEESFEPYGCVKIVNSEDPDDFCIIDICIPHPPPPQKLIGFIRDLEVTNYTVTFHAIIVLKVQYSFPGLIFNRQLVLHNNYEGYLSDCFVWATFSL
jgi:hypothetical protein